MVEFATRNQYNASPGEVHGATHGVAAEKPVSQREAQLNNQEKKIWGWDENGPIYEAPKEQMHSKSQIPDAMDENGPVYSQNLEEAQTQVQQTNKPEKKKEKTFVKMFFDFISNTVLKYTTGFSALLNVTSAAVRTIKEDSKLQRGINIASLLATKKHLLTYAASGIQNAFETKNPILLVAFVWESFASLISGVNNLYLLRAPGPALDQLPTALKAMTEKYFGSDKFETFGEGWQKSWHCIKEMTKEIFKNPSNLWKKQDQHLILFASAMTIASSALGVFVNEKVFGSLRDLFGCFGDWGLFVTKSDTAKKSGFFYLCGSLLDCVARFFKVENIRSAWHEISIALDRIGQYFFIKYRQDEVETKVAQTSDKKIEPKAAPKGQLIQGNFKQHDEKVEKEEERNNIRQMPRTQGLPNLRQVHSAAIQREAA